MVYNKTKRTFSFISALLGLLFGIGAFALSLLGLLGFFVDKKITDCPKYNLDLLIKKVVSNISSFNNKEIFLIIFVAISLLAVLFSIILLKKPLEVDEKFPNLGFYKIVFIILILISGIAIASSNIIAGTDPNAEKMTLSLVVLIVSAVIALLQLISMFFRREQKLVVEPVEDDFVEKNTQDLNEDLKEFKKGKKSKKNKKDKKEEVVPVIENNEVPVQETVKDVPEQVNNDASTQICDSLFNALSPDPVADGFKQRLREIKHLKEVGLLDDKQAAFAVAQIIKNYMK